MQRISLTAVWDDAKAMGHGNVELIATIAGMFILLPGLAIELLVTPPPEGEVPATFADLAPLMMAFITANWPVLLLGSLIMSFGALAILSLLLRPDQPTVRDSLRGALYLMPGYVLASIGQNFVISFGLMLFLLPGLYAIGRLSLIGAVAAAEQQSNPLTLLQRSVALSQDNGWRIAALLGIVYMTTLLLGYIAQILLGLLFTLLLPDALELIATSIISSLFQAVISIAILLVGAALYRSLSGPRLRQV